MAPSELNRDLIRQDKERRLGNLEQELVAAARGATVELSVVDIRKKGLLTVLHERSRRK
jgi:hypothetical protein